MEINLPNNVDGVVQQKAAAAGFGDDINAYIAHLIVSDKPATAPNEAELQKSLSMIAEGEADIEAGRVQDMRQALLNIGAKHGFNLQG